MTQVLEARQAYKQARDDAKQMVDRARARLGQSIVQARDNGETQSKVMSSLKLSREQVRAFEAAYHAWLRDHDGQQP